MLKKIFNVIVGLYSIFGALYCIFWPDDSFLNAGWIVMILLAFIGICAIVSYFFEKRDGKKADRNTLFGGLGGLLLGAVVLALSVLSMLNELVALYFLLAIAIVFTIWLFYSGITGIVRGIRKRKTDNRARWGLILGVGIAEVLFGIIGILDYFVFGAENASIYIGVMLIVFGVCLLLSVFDERITEK